jgi:hypothetical protein
MIERRRMMDRSKNQFWRKTELKFFSAIINVEKNRSNP